MGGGAAGSLAVVAALALLVSRLGAGCFEPRMRLGATVTRWQPHALREGGASVPRLGAAGACRGDAHTSTMSMGVHEHERRVLEGRRLMPSLQNMRQTLGKTRDTSSLVLIADFDRTLTAFRGPNGEPCDECHDIVFDRCSPSSTWAAEVKAFWTLTAQKRGDLTEQSEEGLIALTNWWWSTANEMMLTHKLTHQLVKEAVQKANTSPRPGAMELLHTCISEGVPVVIVSAGLTCVIEEFLRAHDKSGVLLQSPLLTIHANRLDFDERGNLVGFGPNLITTRNKRDAMLNAKEFFDQLFISRKHVLLLGDNINDADVVAHVPASVTAVKVAFANRPDANLTEFQSKFDVVMTGDGPMDYVIQLFEKLVTRPQR